MRSRPMKYDPTALHAVDEQPVSVQVALVESGEVATQGVLSE